jgi:hypothetical protein
VLALPVYGEIEVPSTVFQGQVNINFKINPELIYEGDCLETEKVCREENICNNEKTCWADELCGLDNICENIKSCSWQNRCSWKNSCSWQKRLVWKSKCKSWRSYRESYCSSWVIFPFWCGRWSSRTKYQCTQYGYWQEQSEYVCSKFLDCRNENVCSSYRSCSYKWTCSQIEKCRTDKICGLEIVCKENKIKTGEKYSWSVNEQVSIKSSRFSYYKIISDSDKQCYQEKPNIEKTYSIQVLLEKIGDYTISAFGQTKQITVSSQDETIQDFPYLPSKGESDDSLISILTWNDFEFSSVLGVADTSDDETGLLIVGIVAASSILTALFLYMTKKEPYDKPISLSDLEKYAKNKADNVTDEANDYYNKFKKIVSSPKEILAYHNIPADYSKPTAPSGRKHVDGSYIRPVYGRNSDLTMEQYNKLLEADAQIVPLSSSLIQNKSLYKLGVWFTREGLKWEDLGDGFSESAKIIIGPEIIEKITGILSISLGIFSAILATTCYSLSIISKMIGDSLQEGSIKSNSIIKEKLKTRKNSNLIDAGSLGIFSYIDTMKHWITKDIVDPATIFFYKEVNTLTDYIKGDVKKNEKS